MAETITRKDLATAVERIEGKIDNVGRTVNQRFDRFEAHFDDTMTAIRASLDEIAEQLREERRRELQQLRSAIRTLAERTGNADVAAEILSPVAH